MVVDEVGDVCVKAVVVEFTSNIKTINHVCEGSGGSGKGELKNKNVKECIQIFSFYM